MSDSLDEHLRNLKPLGWMWNGVLHLFSGVTLDEVQGGVMQFMGKIVDSEGNMLQEPQEIEGWEEP